jgi:hypothetical protein
MVKEALIILLQWVDPSVQVVPVSLVCAPVESSESVARNEQRHRDNMADFGKPQPGQIVDPYGLLSDAQREALERGARKAN